jgi:hypothetical protein
MEYMDKFRFLAEFQGLWNAVAYVKTFGNSFPSLVSHQGTTDDVFDWYNRLIMHCANFSGYIPPLHIVSPDAKPYGRWFPDLTPLSQQSMALKFSSALLTCLRSRASGLIAVPELKSIVLRNQCSYMVLYQILEHVGHPRLVPTPRPLAEPAQTSIMSLEEYHIRWCQYVQWCLLSGKVLSD